MDEIAKLREELATTLANLRRLQRSVERAQTTISLGVTAYLESRKLLDLIGGAEPDKKQAP